jgi:hypothetical protein
MCGVWLAMEDIGPDAGRLFYLGRGRSLALAEQ